MIHQYRRVVCDHCGYSVDVPIYCGNRFCIICGGPRLKRVRLRLESLITQVPFISGHDFKHLTLTIRNRQKLPEMVGYLIRCFKLLRRTSYWKEHVSGGAFVIEITGEPGSWHAHLHIIIQCSWMKWEHLVEIWQKVSKGRGVYITRIPKTQIVKYLTKYLTKPSVDDEHLNTVGSSLCSFRLFQTFGKWHSFKTVPTKKPHHCPKCDKTGWTPFDIFYAKLTSRYAKPVPI